jgi:hypothetical protein
MDYFNASKKQNPQYNLSSLSWNKIDFLQSPKKSAKFGDLVFGTVETNRKEKFTGYIQWDHDERLSTDKLDGTSVDGNMSIAFSEMPVRLGFDQAENFCFQ